LVAQKLENPALRERATRVALARILRFHCINAFSKGPLWTMLLMDFSSRSGTVRRSIHHHGLISSEDSFIVYGKADFHSR
jgi:hypothetical protein